MLISLMKERCNIFKITTQYKFVFIVAVALVKQMIEISLMNECFPSII